MYSVSEFRKGLKIEIDGHPYLMVDQQFVKPGKGQAFSRTRLKSLLDGRVIDRTFKIVEKVKPADVSEGPAQYLYADGTEYHFMDNESYEQFTVSGEVLGDTINWMQDNAEVQVVRWNGKPISVDLPNFVVLEVTECEPAVKGDTATGASKQATVETGAQVSVPLFINLGDRLKIDTREGKYVERVRK